MSMMIIINTGHDEIRTLFLLSLNLGARNGILYIGWFLLQHTNQYNPLSPFLHTTPLQFVLIGASYFEVHFSVIMPGGQRCFNQ